VNGKYKDRYYPGLMEHLTTEEKTAIRYLPTIVGFKSPFKIFKTIRSSDFPFLIPDDYLKLSDYLFVLTHPFRAIRFQMPDILFAGYNIGPLLREENRRTCSEFISLLGLLYYRFAFRIAESGPPVRLLVDWYENQVMDRGLIAGFHKFSPRTKIIGYQGYVISKGLHLYTFPNNTEFDGGAVPDIVAVTGKGLKGNISEFCKRVNVEVAPGFRFQKIWRDRKFIPDKSFFSVLMGLPIGLDDSKSILQSLINMPALLKNAELRFFVKPHPTWSSERIKKLFNEGELDAFTFVQGDFHDILETVNLVISNASSVALEAVAKGVPVIIIAPQTGILQNPIPDEVDQRIWTICNNLDELESQIFRFRKDVQEKLVDFETIGNNIRNEYFEPVTRKSIIKFLQL